MAEKIADQTCSVCSQQFVEPKILPCCHTFCLKCLEKTVRDSEKEEEITCPQCCKTHAIPTSGLQGFVTDFSLSHEIEASGLTAPKRQKLICGECECEGPVESYCNDCQSYLCAECGAAHKRFKRYRGHNVISVQDLSVQPKKVHYCSIHSSEVVKLYCETCKMVACRECYLEGHRQHGYQFVQDARKQLSDKLTFLVEDGKQKLAAFKANLGEIQNVETSAARYPEYLKATINNFFDGVIQSTEKRRHQLLAQADTECHDDLKKIWADKVFHQATISEAEDALQFADKANKCTSDVEMIQTTLQSIRQLSQLLAIQWDVSTFNKLVPTPGKFTEGRTLEANTIGQICRAEADDKLRIETLPSSAQLGETVTFCIVPYLVDERSQPQRKVRLTMKPNILVKYGNSQKQLNTVTLAQQPDGVYVLKMRLVCGGKHIIDVKYDDKLVKGSPFELNVSGAPKEGDRVKKGPDWNNLRSDNIKEGIVQSCRVDSSYHQSTKIVHIQWDGVDGVRIYTWENHEVELVL